MCIKGWMGTWNANNLSETQLSILLHIHLEVVFLDPIIVLLLFFFEKLTYCFAWWLYHFIVLIPLCSQQHLLFPVIFFIFWWRNILCISENVLLLKLIFHEKQLGANIFKYASLWLCLSNWKLLITFLE